MPTSLVLLAKTSTCVEARLWISKNGILDMEEAWQKCPRAEWMIWTVGTMLEVLRIRIGSQEPIVHKYTNIVHNIVVAFAYEALNHIEMGGRHKTYKEVLDMVNACKAADYKWAPEDPNGRSGYSEKRNLLKLVYPLRADRSANTVYNSILYRACEMVELTARTIADSLELNAYAAVASYVGVKHKLGMEEIPTSHLDSWSDEYMNIDEQTEREEQTKAADFIRKEFINPPSDLAEVFLRLENGVPTEEVITLQSDIEGADLPPN